MGSLYPNRYTTLPCYRAETLQVTNYNQTLRRTGCIWEISRFPGFLYIYVWFVNLIHKTSTVFIHVHVHNYIYLCTILKQKKFFFQQIYK